MSTTAPTSNAAEKTELPSPAPLRVLFVDDNIQDYRLITVLIRNQAINPYSFHWVRDSKEAREELDREEYDIVAVDYNLGLELGNEVIEELRQRHPDVPYLLITGNEDPEVYKSGITAGADNFIPKGQDCGLLFDRTAQYAHQGKKLENSLKMANAAKDWLMSVLAHDLCEPLAAMSQLLETGTQEARNMPREMLEEIIELAYHSSNETLIASNQLIEWGRSIHGSLKPNMTQTSVRRSIEQAVHLFVPIADQKRVDFRLSGELDAEVLADERMLATIIRNLVSNAVKFSSEDEIVEITGALKNGKLEITVWDNDSRANNRIHQMLQRFETGSKTYDANSNEPTRSGLEVCYHLLDSMGSALYVDHHPEKGAIYSFSLSTRAHRPFNRLASRN